MRSLFLLTFFIMVSSENFSNVEFNDLPEETLLHAVCQSFCKIPALMDCVIKKCDCAVVNLTEFTNLSTLKMPYLYCKEDDLITVRWEFEDDFAYLLDVSTENGTKFYNVTFCNSYEIENLTEDTVYKIRLWRISYVKKKILHSGILEVRTSKKNKIPSPVKFITVENLTLVEDRGEFSYEAVVKWYPNEEYSCKYFLVWSDTTHIEEADINVVTDSYEMKIEDLKFGMEYNMSIRAKTAVHESSMKLLNISIPSCLDTYSGNMDRCIPEKPQGFVVNENVLDEVVPGKDWVSDIHLSWIKPHWAPTYYNACVSYMELKCLNVTRNQTQIRFNRIVLGMRYAISLKACSSIGCSEPAYDIRDRTNVTAVTPTNQLWKTLGLVLIGICILTAILTMLAIIILIRRYRARQQRKEKRFKYFTELEEKVPEPPNNPDVDLIGKGDEIIDQWELDSSKLYFESILGEGAFGVVRRGCLEMKDGTKTQVAIKMLKDSPSTDEIRQFTQEIEIMKSVRQHPCIVSLIGCVSRTRPEGPLLVVEFCSRGDLQSYLRSAWDKFSSMQREFIFNDNEESGGNQNYFANKTYDFHGANRGDELIIQPKHLLSIARQVALGMEHLAKTRVVHRDLAARNVLVCEDHTVKVSDFGLSRDIYQDNIYCKSGGGKLPIRWMALESLTHQRYTTQSDVWSFGILLWEIFTLGGTPYVGIHSYDLLELLKNGYRLKCPSTCSSDLYTVMQSCWKACPKDRPTFSELCKSLENLLENMSQYLQVEDESSSINSFSSDKSTNRDKSTYERYIQPITSTCK